MMSALCILDVGVCTAVGLTAASAAAAVRAGISRFSEHDRFLDRHGEPAVVSVPPGIAGLSITDALSSMALTALSSPSTVARREVHTDLAVFLVLPEPRPGIPPDLADIVSGAVADRLGPAHVILSPALGHAAAGRAFEDARAFLADAPKRLAIVLGVDSYDAGATISWLDAGRQLHAAYNAWGFVPGAAAGACLLCHPRHALSGRSMVKVEDLALAQEEAPIKSDDVCLGRTLTTLVERLADDDPFDTLYCDLNGEVYRSDELGFMLSRSSRRFREPGVFCAPADCWGDVGAASLPLFAALATQAATRGYGRGPLSLLLAGSEGGLRAGLRLRAKS